MLASVALVSYLNVEGVLRRNLVWQLQVSRVVMLNKYIAQYNTELNTTGLNMPVAVFAIS